MKGRNGEDKSLKPSDASKKGKFSLPVYWCDASMIKVLAEVLQLKQNVMVWKNPFCAVYDHAWSIEVRADGCPSREIFYDELQSHHSQIEKD